MTDNQPTTPTMPHVLAFKKEIKELKEENETLTQDICDYENGLGKYDFDPSLSQKALCKIVNEWELGNCHLHDEIKKLKDMNAKKHKHHKNKCKEVKDLRWLMNTRAGEHLDDKQTIVELKKVISDRDDEIQHKNKLFEEWGAENKELKNQNSDYKSKIINLINELHDEKHKDGTCDCKEIMELKTEIMELKKEIEKLTKD
jgi:chromosome segregation ATPase